MEAKEYFVRDTERDAFYRTFYQVCRRFNVTWSTATPKEKAFVEEVTRVPISTVRPLFGDTAC